MNNFFYELKDVSLILNKHCPVCDDKFIQWFPTKPLIDKGEFYREVYKFNDVMTICKNHHFIKNECVYPMF